MFKGSSNSQYCFPTRTYVWTLQVFHFCIIIMFFFVLFFLLFHLSGKRLIALACWSVNPIPLRQLNKLSDSSVKFRWNLKYCSSWAIIIVIIIMSTIAKAWFGMWSSGGQEAKSVAFWETSEAADKERCLKAVTGDEVGVFLKYSCHSNTTLGLFGLHCDLVLPFFFFCLLHSHKALNSPCHETNESRFPLPVPPTPSHPRKYRGGWQEASHPAVVDVVCASWTLWHLTFILPSAWQPVHRVEHCEL